MAFSDDELERYARHIILREVGGQGQVKIAASKIALIGAGGLGSPALLYLSAAGVGKLGIIDDDVVSLSNLQRQIVHVTSSIGQPKTSSAAQTLRRVNPHVEVVAHTCRLTSDNASELLSGYDLVLDGSDNFDTRYLVNATCVSLKIPLIAGAMTQWEGQLSLYDPANGDPCYECVFPEAPADGLVPSCAEAGVLGSLAGVIGSMMATEALKHITGAGKTLNGELLIYDALWGESRKLKIKSRADCPVCGMGQS